MLPFNLYSYHPLCSSLSFFFVINFHSDLVDDHTFHSRRTPLEEEGEPTNQRAMEVIDRIKLKLCGRDFNVNQVRFHFLCRFVCFVFVCSNIGCFRSHFRRSL
jgi:hypothetical protein